MVEVLKSPPEWQKIHTCSCKAQLRIKKEDIKIGFFGPNWGGETPERLPYVDCPACSKTITFLWSEIAADLAKNEYAK